MRLTNSMTTAQIARTAASTIVAIRISLRVLWIQKLSTKKHANMKK
jgi:hypothetical protein